MPTIVVNIRLEPYDVYVGRRGHGHDGIFGNPFRPGEDDRETCLERFKRYFLDRLDSDQAFWRRVCELRGKRLGCFCAGKGGLPAEADPLKAECHGQIIAAWCDGLMGW